jgi:aspartate/methionine/tyrosine aminotransferase
MTDSSIKKVVPLDAGLLESCIKKFSIRSLSTASIREIVRLSSELEKDSGVPFIRMEMGVPGLFPNQIGVAAEIEALKRGVASKYPSIEGIPELKAEISRFAKLFMDIDAPPDNCFPSVGSMQGSFAAFMTAARRDKKKDTTLFIDPGFPVQKQQHKVLGLKYESFDVYDFRGEKLRAKIESFLKKGNISSVIYSNPNNPSWISFTEKELETIGSLCGDYDVIAIEDLAYFAMDFRKDYSVPGQAPFQPTVAKFADNYIVLVSSSKIFSYAGQRIAAMIVSGKLFNRNFNDLENYFGADNFGRALVYGALYSLSSGTGHSSQFALAAMLRGANDGRFNIVSQAKEYGERAALMKKIFTGNGFRIVYDKDGEEDIANGFYFTLAYPKMNSEELLFELLRYGVSAISLKITGSERDDGIRACVSLADRGAISELGRRMLLFRREHKRGSSKVKSFLNSNF